MLNLQMVGRLSAIPTFLRSTTFWMGALDPRVSLYDSPVQGHREFTAAHCWGLRAPSLFTSTISDAERSTIEVALAMLQRGAWTNCSWMVEQALAERFETANLGVIKSREQGVGSLGFEAQPAKGLDIKNALITGRLPSEIHGNEIAALWREGNRRAGSEGSDAEWEFFESVLAPTLGYPLLDYVRFQPLLTQLGLDSPNFAEQRADFALETGRGLKIVIEIDGSHHEQPVQAAQDRRRDYALKDNGWYIWRVPTRRLQSPEGLRDELRALLRRTKRGTWKLDVDKSEVRSADLMEFVWGATVVARIQFLLLQSLLNVKHRSPTSQSRTLKTGSGDFGISMACRLYRQLRWSITTPMIVLCVFWSV